MNSTCLIQNNSAVPLQSSARKLFCEWIKHCVSVLILQVCLFVLTSGALTFADDSDQALYIDAEGNVGIGKNDPKAALDVSGAILGIGMVPQGGIVMYYGDIKTNFDENGKGVENTPCEGWQLCNGENTSPDLRDRFVVAAGGKYKVEDPPGGSDTITLTIDQMPKHGHGKITESNGIHKHAIKMADKVGESGRERFAEGRLHKKYNWNAPKPILATGQHKHTIKEQGGNGSFDNRPSYYVLAFIIKLPDSPAN